MFTHYYLNRPETHSLKRSQGEESVLEVLLARLAGILGLGVTIFGDDSFS
jgi:hypothetical protein